MAEVIADRRATNLQRGRVTLFPESKHAVEVETAVHEVRAGGSAKFIASATTNLGMDDAHALRAKAQGQAPFIPIWKRIMDRLAKGETIPRPKPGQGAAAPGAPAAKVEPGSPEQLAQQMAAFSDDPEMQQIVFAKWQAKRQELGMAPTVALPPEPDEA